MFIKKQFLNHTVKKTYSALVEGVPKAEEGIINFQIRLQKRIGLKKWRLPSRELFSRRDQ